MTKPPEREWHDPPGVEPEGAETKKQEPGISLQTTGHKDRIWKVFFVGMLYLFTGVILEVVIIYSGIPIDKIPAVFMLAGGAFLIMGGILIKREGNKNGGV